MSIAEFLPRTATRSISPPPGTHDKRAATTAATLSALLHHETLREMRSLRFALPILVLSACGDDTNPTVTMSPLTSEPSSNSPSDPTGSPSSEPTTSNDTGQTGELPLTSTTATTDPPEADAPVFLSFGTNVSTVTAGESVIFTAVLTHPDGVADIVGGTLTDPSGNISYGPFMAAGQPGTYSISLSWDAMNQAETIQFEQTELVRTFRAEFFDQAAYKVSEDTALTLTCAGGSACDGVCVDLMTNAEHCGSCAKFCESGCQEGGCAPDWGECIYMSTGFMSCDAYCASIDESCVEGGCEGGYTILAYSDGLACVEEMGEVSVSESCDLVQPWSLGRAAIRCCCTTP